ncbi:MAG: hypothetical protein GXO09_01570 [Crenarchaeota archaeon]|nr:hypothetical protein [Thermoproteota archaeon]
MKKHDPLLEAPDDVIEEVLEEERRAGLLQHGRRRGRRLPYPHGSDIARAVREAAAMYIGHPDGFPDLVYELLKARGFYTGFVTVKRIWRTYERLVKKGVMRDVLGVINDNEYRRLRSDADLPQT